MMHLACQQASYGVRKGDHHPLQKRQWRSQWNSYRTRRQQGGEFFFGAAIQECPRLRDFQRQKQIRTRKRFSKRRKSVPKAPFNNSSFLMSVRQAGGLASLISPASKPLKGSGAFQLRECQSRGVKDLVEDVKDLVVDGYGSMAGLIHLRTIAGGMSNASADVDDEVAASGHSHDVEARLSSALSVQQVEMRLDQDVSRFVMIHPTSGDDVNNMSHVMDFRLAEQERHIAYLEDENSSLKEQLFMMQHETNALRQRLRGGFCDGMGDENDDDVCSGYGSST